MWPKESFSKDYPKMNPLKGISHREILINLFYLVRTYWTREPRAVNFTDLQIGPYFEVVKQEFVDRWIDPYFEIRKQGIMDQ